MTPSVTRTSLLDAAERLFAERGFEATSIRMITDAAGANVASVNYHFGSKEDLLRRVTDRVAHRIGELRGELLDAAVEAASPEEPSVEALLEAFVRADLIVLREVHERGPTVARFLGRTYGDQTPWIQAMAAEQFGAARERFIPRLAAALPHLTPTALGWRMERVVAVIVHLFATWPEAGMTEAETEETLAHLVGFLAAALRSPLPGGGGEAPVV